MNHVTFNAKLDVTAAEGKQPTVSVEAYNGGPMRVAMGDVVIDLAGLAMPKQVPLLLDHDNSIGSIIGGLEPKRESHRLTASGVLAGESPAVRHVVALAKAGINLQAIYHYYLCSRKMRYDGCQHGGRRVREDSIMQIIQSRFTELPKYRGPIIARALELAREAVRSNHTDADRIKGELADLDAQAGRLVELLMDRAIGDTAKAAINRKLADTEQQRIALLAALDGLREQATADTEGLADAIEAAFETAVLALADATTPEKLNRFIEQFIGPIVVDEAGVIHRKQTPPVEAGGIVQSNIAGGGFEPPTSGL